MLSRSFGALLLLFANAPQSYAQAPDVTPERLDGKSVLVIATGKSPEATYLLRGTAHLKGADLEVQPDSAGVAQLLVTRSDVEKNGFKTGMMRHLVGEEKYLKLVDRMTKGVAGCLVILTETPPAGAIATPGLLGGMAMWNGEIHLMQVR